MMRRGARILFIGLAGCLALGAGSPPRAVTFDGRVFDPDGHPAGAATVFVSIYEPGWIGAWTPNPTPLIRQTRAAADGSFHLAVSLPGDWGWATLVALKEGYGPAGAGVDADAETTGLALALTRPSFVAGTVVDAAGRPIAGAKVIFQSGIRPGLEPVFPLPESVRPPAITDVRGRFRMAPFPAQSELYLNVEHLGYARLTGQRTPVHSGTGSLTIRLQRASAISGRVLDAAGGPASHVTVRCQPNGPPPPDVTTDAAGRFRFSELPSGGYTVSVVPQEGLSEFGGEPQRVEVREGAEARCPDLRLAPTTSAALVTGKVADAATGEPVAGVGLVSLRVPDAPGMIAANGPIARTGADGAYRLRLPPGKWRLYPSLLPRGYFSGPPPAGPSDFTLAEGQLFTRDFTLWKGVLVLGQVLDAAGRPAVGARVKAAYFMSAAGQPRRPVHAPSPSIPGAGSVLWHLPESEISKEPQRLTVLSRDGTQGAQVELAPDTTKRDLVLRLQRLPRVTGRVTDERGAPIPAARVRVDQVTAFDRGERSELLTETLADPRGGFTLALPPGLTYRVSAEADGYSIAARYPVELERGKPAATLSLRLPRADRAIAGVVVDSDYKPLAGAQVTAWQSSAERFPLLHPWATTDGQGRFRIDHLPRGEFSVSVSMSGYGFDRKAAVPAGTTNMRLMLAPMETTGPPPPRLLSVGARAPELLIGRWVNGAGPESLAAVQGKTVVLQFSSAYNRAAAASNAALKDLYARLRAAGRDDVVILALYDSSASAPEIETYARSERLPFPIGLVARGVESPTFRAYGVRQLPTLFVIDGAGIVRAVNPVPEALLKLGSGAR